MTNGREKWRVNFIFGMLILAVAALGVRLFFLVHTYQGRARSIARTQQRMIIPTPAKTGTIIARSRNRGVTLAASRQVPSCFVDPHLLGADKISAAAEKVAKALNMDPAVVQERLFERRDSRFVWVKRAISSAEVAAIGKLRMQAVGIIHEWRRDYPNDSLAATVLGFRRIDGQPGGGLELTLDKHLAATDGKRVILADARRRPIWPLVADSKPAVDGGHVMLTIDAVIQGYLQQAVASSVEKFDAEWGTGIVIDPQSGEILAMCSAPTFNPNNYNTANPAHFANRAINSPFEAGSVLKPIFAAAAVQTGRVTYDTEIHCEDGVRSARGHGRISDHGKSYGLMSLTDVIVNSSNIGMSKIGDVLGNRLLYQITRSFGFGRPTGISLPAEEPGQVRPLAKWDGYSTWRVPFGQEVSVTPIQLIMSYGAFANGGLLLKPKLIESLTDSSGNVVQRNPRRVVRRVLTREVADESLDVLAQVVQRGTGRACRLSRWTSFGKSGTAQIPGPGGYPPGRYAGTFIAGAPAKNPRVLCLISIYLPDPEKGYYGAVVAAPYVKQVLERTLTHLDVPTDSPGELALSD